MRSATCALQSTAGSSTGISSAVRDAVAWLMEETGLSAGAAEQAVAYLADGRRVLGVIPSQDTLVLERFFDESGGMQLVLHAPYGSRITKAWGLALRKRFCRQFNFELQAAATEDGLMLSLGPQHSFPLSDVFRYLHPETTRDVLVQAFLDAPIFETRWRWNATISLAVPRTRGARKLAPQVQRMLAADLLASVFPDAAACLENIPGDRQIPDHPLVGQTVRDCLEEAMDLDGLNAVLGRIHRGEVTAGLTRHARAVGVCPRDPRREAVRVPRRRAARRAAEPRGPDAARHGDAGSDDLGALDQAAIDRVRAEARPDPRNPDELHDALMTVGCILDVEMDDATRAFHAALAAARRACCCRIDGAQRQSIQYVAAERIPELLAIHPGAVLEPPIDAPRIPSPRVGTDGGPDRVHSGTPLHRGSNDR